MYKTHLSSKGHTYYIKARTTKKGNTTYLMTKKESPDCLTEIPKGYEIFEKPDTRIPYIRKKIKSAFSAKDLMIVRTEISKNDAVVKFTVDAVGNLLKIYAAEKPKPLNSDNNSAFVNMMMAVSRADAAGGLMQDFIRQEELYRISKEKDGYELKRYCYRGSTEDWIFVDFSSDLKSLAREYMSHLGKESFYTLPFF